MKPDDERNGGTKKRNDEEETDLLKAGDTDHDTSAEEPDPPKPDGIRAFVREVWKRLKEARPQKPTEVKSRRQVNDRSRAFLLLASAVVVIGFVFLAMFSTSSSEKRAQQRRTTPRLGRPETAVSEQRSGSAVPLLSAEQAARDPNTDQLGPDDILATSRRNRVPQQLSPEPPKAPRQYALRTVRPLEHRAPLPPALPVRAVDESENLKKPSLVFVRNAVSANVVSTSYTPTNPAYIQRRAGSTLLPVGSRLVARLQNAISTAVKTPAIAVIEYNYERDSEIVIPAGTRAIGELQQANQHGHVGIRFTQLQLPDGRKEAIEGSSVGLDYGPLKGLVNGRNRGKRALIRSLTGIGTMAAYVVGGRGYGGLSGPINQSVLLRERVASNIGLAGEQELMAMAYSQNIVITVPGNTRFYIVLQEAITTPNTPDTIPTAAPSTSANLASAGGYGGPTAAELRDLIALKSELERLYREVAATRTAEPQPPPQQ